MAQSQGREVESGASHTQAEEVDGAIVQEVADVPGVLGHGAEGMCTAGCKGVHAAGAHVHKQRPGVAVILDICHIQCGNKPPHEEPGTHHGPHNPGGWRFLLYSPPHYLLLSIPLGWPIPTFSHFGEMPCARVGEWGLFLVGNRQEGQEESLV